MTRKVRFFALAAVLVIALPVSSVMAQEAAADAEPMEQMTESAEGVLVNLASDIELADGPPSLPAGSKIVILEGDLTKAVPITFRLQFPADYSVPPHWHSVIEHVTVLSGTLHVGMGEVVDRTAGLALTSGSFAAMPKGMVHHAWTEDEPVVLQLHSTGPWTITYVNPEDDPRNAE